MSAADEPAIAAAGQATDDYHQFSPTGSSSSRFNMLRNTLRRGMGGFGSGTPRSEQSQRAGLGPTRMGGDMDMIAAQVR